MLVMLYYPTCDETDEGQLRASSYLFPAFRRLGLAGLAAGALAGAQEPAARGVVQADHERISLGC